MCTKESHRCKVYMLWSWIYKTSSYKRVRTYISYFYAKDNNDWMYFIIKKSRSSKETPIMCVLLCCCPLIHAGSSTFSLEPLMPPDTHQRMCLTLILFQGFQQLVPNIYSTSLNITSYLLVEQIYKKVLYYSYVLIWLWQFGL